MKETESSTSARDLSSTNLDPEVGNKHHAKDFPSPNPHPEVTNNHARDLPPLEEKNLPSGNSTRKMNLSMKSDCE